MSVELQKMELDNGLEAVFYIADGKRYLIGFQNPNSEEIKVKDAHGVERVFRRLE